MFKKIILLPTDKTLLQVIRYGIAGFLAFTMDVTTLYLLTERCAFNYMIAAIFGFIAGMSVSYILDAYWVFNAHTLRSRKLELLLFFLMNLVGLGINELVIWIFTEYVKIYYLFSKIVASFFVYLWNFYSRKYILFNHRTEKKMGIDPELLKDDTH